MRKKRNQFLSLVVSTLLTISLFGLFSIFNLEHLLSFILPVPLAIHIIRYKVKDAIIPALILIILAPFVAHFINPGYWTRGMIVMPAAMLIAFLHGGLGKTKMTHMRELLIVICADITTGFLMGLYFYLLNDPDFSLAHEFHHFFVTVTQLFNLQSGTNKFINAEFFINNIWFGYIVVFGLCEAILTHILIHFAVKWGFRSGKGHTFSGLNFTIIKKWIYPFLSSVTVTLLYFFLFDIKLSVTVSFMAIIIANFMMISSFVVALQGIIVFVHLSALKIRPNISVLVFTMGLILFPISIIVGVLDAFFEFQSKLIIAVAAQDKDYFSSVH